MQARHDMTVGSGRHMAIRQVIARRYNARSLDEVMHAIAGQIHEGAADPEVIMLARQITSGTVDWVEDPRAPRGYRDTPDLVPVVRAFGKTFRAPAGPICKAKDDGCELEAIWDFCVMNVRYVLDPARVDTYPDVRFILRAGSGDCDDFTIVMCALCESIGFNMATRVISTSGQSWEHIYPMAGLPKASAQVYLPMDATENGKHLGWEYPHARAIQDYLL